MPVSKRIGCEISAANGDDLLSLEKDTILRCLRRHGFVHFRGFTPSQSSFEAFMDRFGSCTATRHVHYPENGEALGFHSEDAYNPFRPDTIWFFCAFEGSDGGIPTGVVDGCTLLNELPRRWQEFCRESSVRFDRQWDADVWRSSHCAPSPNELASALDKFAYGIDARVLPDNTLYVGYEVPIVTRTSDYRESFSNSLLQAAADPEFYGISLNDGSALPAELITIVEELALCQEVNVTWSTGDVLAIDNLRMMHRRAAYRQVDRDLRARHGENFLGSPILEVQSQTALWLKKLVQGDIAVPSRVGLPYQKRRHV